MKINKWNQSQIIKKLLALTEKNDIVQITPGELLDQMWEFGVMSKRDLPITLKNFGLCTKVLFINGHHARYYTLVKNELTQIRAYLETQVTQNAKNVKNGVKGVTAHACNLTDEVKKDNKKNEIL